MVQEYLEQEANNQIYEDLIKNTTEDTAVEESTEETAEIPIDFVSLKEINEDIYAWIDIPDTNIHYPIVQSSTDDNYYLNHTIEGKEGYPGSIYTQSRNKKDFTDFNTVIYGHNMKNGSMFQNLHKFTESDFFEEHDSFTIYTETEVKEYTIFAAVVYDDRHLLYFYDMEDPEDRLEFIDSIYDSKNMKNQIREGVTADADSKLVTLSTCIGGQDEKRLLVIGVEK